MRTRESALVAALLTAAVAGSCVDAPTAPRRPVGNVALAPRFAHAVAASIVDVSAVRVTLSRGVPPRVLVDTVVFFAPEADSISLLLSAPITGSSETFDLRLAMVNAQGDTVFRAGPTPVTLSTTPQRTALEPVLQYSGPGAAATSLRFVAPPSAIFFGDTVTLSAEALNAQQQPIAGTPIGFALADSADTIRATIPDARSGRLVAGTQRGTVTVRAFTPSDLGVTHVIAVQPVATALRSVAGDDQIGEVGTTLAQPLVVQVIAGDSLGVAGAQVAFAVTTGDAVLSDAVVLSDADGNASTSVQLGPTLGPVEVSATLVGSQAAPIVFTATATPGPPAQLEFSTEPVTRSADGPLASVQVSIRDANGFLVDTATATVSLALSEDPSGVNPLQGTLAVAAVNGVATFSDLRIGSAATGYRLEATAPGLSAANSALFNVTPGVATALEFATQPPNPLSLAATFEVSVVARDAQGNAATGFTGAIALALDVNPSAAALTGPTTVNAVAGTATFSGLAIDNIGSGYTLRASAGGLSDALSDAFDVAPPPSVNAWVNAASGNWNVASNWSRGTVPTSTDTVWIRQSGTYTVTISDSRTIGKLLVGGSSGTQTLAVTAGIVTLADTAQLLSSTALTVSGGQLTGGGLMVADGAVTWSGGDLRNGGGVLRVGPTGTLLIGGTASRFLSAFALELAGSGTWTGTHLINSGNAAALRVLPGATLDIQGDATLDYNFGGAPTVFENQGSVIRSTSAGTFTTDAQWVNAGDLQVNTGVLVLSGGGSQTGTTAVAAGAQLTYGGGAHTLDAASSHALAGTIAVTAGSATAAGPITGVGHLRVSGGTLAYNAAGGTVDSLAVSAGRLTGAGLLTVATRMEWSGGDLQNGGGAVRVGPAGTLLIDGTASRFLSAYTLELAGAGIWTGTHLVNSGNAAVLRVLAGGTLDIQGDATLDYNFGGAQTAIDNQGVITRSTSLGSFTTDAQLLNAGELFVNTGTVVLSGGGTQSGPTTVAAAATLQFAGGTHALGAGATVDVNGVVSLTSGTVTALGPWLGPGRVAIAGGTLSYGAATGGVDTLTVAAGAVGGPAGGVLTVGQAMSWSGGALQGGGGTLRVPAAASLDISGAGTRSLGAAVLEANGGAVWRDTHTINSGSGGVLRFGATGTLDIQGDPSVAYNLGGAAPSVEFLGSVTRSASAGSVSLSLPVTLGGALDIQSGSLRLLGNSTLGAAVTVAAGSELQLPSGTHTMQSGFGVSGAGLLRLAGGSLAGLASGDTARVERLAFAGGSLAPTAGAVLRVDTAMTWTAGSIGGGTLLIPAAATLTSSGTSTRSLSAAMVDVSGSFVLNESQTINTGGGAQVFVRAGGLMQTAQPVGTTVTLSYNLGGAAPLLTVEGSLELSTAGSTSLVLPVDLLGAVTVNAGTLNLSSTGAISGTVNNVGGSTLFNGGLYTLGNGTALTGNAFALSSGALETAAASDTVSISTLNLTGGALNQNGTFEIGTFNWSGGSLSGGGNTVALTAMDISGTATRTLNNGRLENVGSGSVSGTFSLNSGAGAQLVNRGSLVWSGDATFAYNTGGAQPVLVNLGTFSRLGATPTSLATISAYVVDTASSAFAVDAGQLRLAGGARLGGTPFLGGVLEISDNTVELRQGMSWSVDGGSLRLAGGTLTADSGSVITMPPFAMSSGSVEHSATLNFPSTLDWSGGMLASTGGLGFTRITAGGQLNISGAAAKTLQGPHVLELATGAVGQLAGSGNVNSGGGAELRNAGLFELVGGGSLLYTLGGTVPLLRNTAGATLRSSGAATGSVDFAVVNAGGALSVTGDSLRLTRGSAESFAGTATVASAALVLGGGTFTLSGALGVAGASGDLVVRGGTLNLNGQSLSVAGDFSTQGSGVLASSSAAALLDVEGNVTFAGGNTAPSAGTLDVAGNFTQAGATNAFAPTGSFRTLISSTANTQTISFANPGASSFRRLEVLSGERGVAIASDVVVNDSLVLLAGAWNYDLTGVGGTERLTVVGGLRLAQATGSARLAPPVLLLSTPPSVAPFIGGTRGMSPDTTVYVGTGVTSLPVGSGIRYNSVRLANGQIVAMPSDTIAGDLHVASGRASFASASTFRIGGKLRTTGTGTLGMSNAAAAVTVVDSAVFSGGSTSGLLTAGLLRLSGAFVQEGATTSAFRATGAHRTAFVGSAVQRVRMNNAGSAATASRFQSVELGTPTQAALLNLETPVFAGALRDTTAALTDELATSVDALISVDSATLSSTRFNGVRLALVSGGVFHSLQSLTFANMNPALTYLYADVNDITVVTVNGVNFQTTATTGYYVHVNQVANPLGGLGAISLAGSVTPATPLGRYLRTTVTGLTPSVIWLGVPNP